MKISSDSQRKRTNHDLRGQKGSTEIRHAYSILDLNWQRMNERRDNRGRYYPNAKIKLMPAVLSEPRLRGCGAILGYQIIIRGSPEYHY